MKDCAASNVFINRRRRSIMKCATALLVATLPLAPENSRKKSNQPCSKKHLPSEKA